MCFGLVVRSSGGREGGRGGGRRYLVVLVMCVWINISQIIYFTHFLPPSLPPYSSQI